MLSMYALKNLAGNLHLFLKTHTVLYHKLGESSQITILRTREM